MSEAGARVAAVAIIFVLDALVVGVLFRVLSGVRARRRHLIVGALIGGAGLTVLQQLSSLFVGGAASNPLLASFASLIALLLWFNFSAQVVLIACAYIVTTVDEQNERVGTVYGVETFAQRTVRAAERDVIVAQDALVAARDAEHAEREKQAARREK